MYINTDYRDSTVGQHDWIYLEIARLVVSMENEEKVELFLECFQYELEEEFSLDIDTIGEIAYDVYRIANGTKQKSSETRYLA